MQCKDLNYYKNLIETEKDFFSELGNVIYFIDNTGVFCLVSGNVQDTLGYDYDDMIGKSFLEFVVEEDKEIALKSFSAIWQTQREKTRNLRVHLRHKDGYPVLIELNSKTVFDQEGKFCCVYGVASDQSEEEKIQKALKSERDLLAKTNKDLLLSYQAIGRINAQISSLIEVNTTFSSAMPWGEKVEYLFHSIAQFIKADLGSLRVWNQQQEEMVQFAEYIADEGKQEFLEKARKARSFKEMYIQCIDQKKVVRIDDTNLNKNYECYEISKKYNIESVIFVPVILSGEVYGAMGFYLHNRKLSQDINHKILMLYSSQVAIGLLLSGDLDDTISKL